MKFLCAVLVLAVTLQHQTSAAESFKPFRMKALDGPERSLSDVLGKATLVVFFFPTCGFCNAAFPSMQRLHDTYKDRGLSTVWINVVPEEERLIEAWRTKYAYSVPILLGTRSAQNTYKVTMTPTYYLLDSKGMTILKRTGYKAGDEQALEQDIQKALELNRQ